MRNIFFDDEIVTENDLYFICYMIEKVSRHLHQRNQYIVNIVPQEEWRRLICLSGALHCENPDKVIHEWIEDYQLEQGNFEIENVDKELVSVIPSPTEMGKVYTRLIVDTMTPDEDYIDALLRVYNDGICLKLDDYNCSAYYEPSYVIARAYLNGGF